MLGERFLVQMAKQVAPMRHMTNSKPNMSAMSMSMVFSMRLRLLGGFVAFIMTCKPQTVTTKANPSNSAYESAQDPHLAFMPGKNDASDDALGVPQAGAAQQHAGRGQADGAGLVPGRLAQDEVSREGVQAGIGLLALHLSLCPTTRHNFTSSRSFRC